MHGMWESKKSGNNYRKSNNDQKGNKEEKQAYNAEMKKLIRQEIKEMFNAESAKETNDTEQYNLENFRELQLSDSESKQTV